MNISCIYSLILLYLFSWHTLKIRKKIKIYSKLLQKTSKKKMIKSESKKRNNYTKKNKTKLITQVVIFFQVNAIRFVKNRQLDHLFYFMAFV